MKTSIIICMLLVGSATAFAEELPPPAVAQAEAQAAAQGQTAGKPQGRPVPQPQGSTKPDLLAQGHAVFAGAPGAMPLGADIPLNQKQQASVDISKQFQQAGAPVRGLDGAVIYIFGDGLPEVVCSPLEECDIELEKGEVVTSNPAIGDMARWLIQFIAGTENNPPHFTVKPSDIGLQTSMVITTDRRTYHIHLVSRANEYTALTKFVYPEEMLQVRQQKAAQAQAAEEHLAVSPFPGGQILTTDKLDFRYRITGKAPFNPVRVYNDGVHTIIQLPEEVRTEEAPILMLTNRDAPSSAGPTAAVNYRLINNRFIVDSIFQEAVLVSGVGSRAKVIHITHIASDGSPFDGN